MATPEPRKYRLVRGRMTLSQVVCQALWLGAIGVICVGYMALEVAYIPAFAVWMILGAAIASRFPAGFWWSARTLGALGYWPTSGLLVVTAVGVGAAEGMTPLVAACLLLSAVGLLYAFDTVRRELRLRRLPRP